MKAPLAFITLHCQKNETPFAAIVTVKVKITMAATAAAAVVGSSFSQSIHTLKCLRFKQLAAADHHHNPLLRIPSARVLSPSSISHHQSYFTHELFPTAVVTVQKWRALKVSAAVAEQETAVTAESPVEEEKIEGGEGEAEAEVESTVTTKLYFGNLPYNVDSAQLAGIIQEYGSPELVEVRPMSYVVDLLVN